MKIRHIVMVGAMTVSFAALAGETGNEKAFNNLDKNGDGVISKEEAAGVEKLAVDFTVIDINNNGTIEVAEFAALESVEAYTPVEGEDEPIGAAPTK
ncbi:hypothetical protein [Kaarinaea lacus]